PKFPAHDGVLAVGHSRPRLDLPFVLEDAGRLPDKDASCHVESARTGTEVNGAARAPFDRGRRHVPSREVLRFRERLPYDPDWMPNAPFKCEGRVVAIEHECARPRGVRCRHWDCFPLVLV